MGPTAWSGERRDAFCAQVVLRICGLLFAATSCRGNSKIFWQRPRRSQVESKGNLFQPLSGYEEVPGGWLFGLVMEPLKLCSDLCCRKCVFSPYHASAPFQNLIQLPPTVTFLYYSVQESEEFRRGRGISQSHSNSRKLTLLVLGEETC